jgi:hypothetical protein
MIGPRLSHHTGETSTNINPFNPAGLLRDSVQAVAHLSLN